MAEQYAEFHIGGGIRSDLLHEFLQLIRTFESKHTEDCHLNIEIKGTDSTREMLDILRLNPNIRAYQNLV